MTFLLNSRATSILFRRLNAKTQHQYKLYSMFRHFRHNNSNIPSSHQTHSICASVQSIRSAHSLEGNKKLQLEKDEKNVELGESVYKGKYVSQILRVKMFSMATSVLGAATQPMLWQKGLEVSGVGVGITICSLVGIFTFVTPVLLHLVVRKYVVDILYNKETDQYTATTISPLMFRKKVTYFRLAEIGEKNLLKKMIFLSSIHIGHFQGGRSYSTRCRIHVYIDSCRTKENPNVRGFS